METDKGRVTDQHVSESSKSTKTCTESDFIGDFTRTRTNEIPQGLLGIFWWSLGDSNPTLP